MDVTCVDVHSEPWVVKRATSADESARLRHEAAVLRQAAHPGVVELGHLEVGADQLAILSTRHAEGCDLSTICGLDVAEVSGLGAAVATILADLHDLGISHGAVCAEHIIVVGADGRPVLCSLGRAASTRDVDPFADVAALRRLLSERLPPGAPRRLTRLLREPSGRSRRRTARALAASLVRIVPDARLPVLAMRITAPTPGPGAGSTPALDPAVPDPEAAAQSAGPDGHAIGHHPLRLAPWAIPDRTSADRPDAPGPNPPLIPPAGAPLLRRRRLARTAVVGVAALVVTVACFAAIAASGALTGGPDRAAPSTVGAPSTVAAPCPVVDDGCGPVPSTDGRFSTPSGSFAVDLPALIVVVGRWECRSPSLPAALDPRSGRVWVWDRWPGASTIAARSLGQVPRATTLAVIPRVSGCDWLEVARSAGAPIVIHPLPEASRD